VVRQVLLHSGLQELLQVLDARIVHDETRLHDAGPLDGVVLAPVGCVGDGKRQAGCSEAQLLVAREAKAEEDPRGWEARLVDLAGAEYRGARRAARQDAKADCNLLFGARPHGWKALLWVVGLRGVAEGCHQVPVDLGDVLAG
jgi:hypothetical protein